MGTKAITVPVVAELQMELKSLQNIEKVLTDTFNKAGTGTTLAKNLSNSLTKIRPLLKEYEQLQIQPGIDTAGLRRMNSIFNSIFNEYTKRAAEIEFMSPENMLPESALTRIREMRAELANLQKDLAAIERNGASGRTEDLLKASPQHADLHNRAKAVSTKYSGEDTIAANARALEQEAASAQNKVSDLEAAGEKLAQALKTAQANLDSARQALQSAEKDAQTAKAAKERSNKVRNEFTFLQMLEGLRARETKSGKIDIEGWHDTKESRAAYTNEEGNLSANVSLALRKYLEGLKFDDKTITDILGASFKQIPDLIAKAFADAAKAGETTLEEQFAKASQVAGDLRGTVVPKNVGNVEIWADTTNKNYQAAQKKLEQAKGKLQKYEQEFGEADVAVYENQEALRAAQETADALSTVSAALTEVAKTAKEAAAALKREEIQNSERNIDTETQGTVGTIKSGIKQVNSEDIQENHRVGTGAQAEQIDKKTKTQQDAESFKQNLQQSIKQWMSAQQIVNMVKDGIRQAYQDIQGLDKAMTNIAVVTDMSVGDLWGKINEYMTVAQQYGVSTQGVYEVSQLYYQQGLGTADVMAATTETLKMARIAGMDYADAADAMTVAIRSFKMEMSDAAHVTDVYSKVAAITASDSEELAIAMSKTASSAENVGSSFENTTAMLAVMIETTRESAQNLGSALKSIISRYGEMKVGATVDADGEALDYNKVDTALKSIGISIKDAQGQFRDFDDVIFELSSKWDSLDSVTQRYIATIMAGNRQQSRFIALVDNWERLDEVSGAAQNSDDAGLVQYAKTLDSLESKLNNIKTSFQEFYMSIVNGPVVSAALDFINNLLQGLNQLGSLQGILNIANLIAGLKTGLSLLGNLFANSFSSIVANWKAGQEEMVSLAFKYGQDKHKAEIAGYNSIDENGQQKLGAGQNQQAPTTKNGKKPADTWWGEDQSYSFGVRNEKSGKVGKLFQYKNEKHAFAGKIVGAATGLAGTALTAAGTAVAANNPRAGAWMSAGGNALQGVSMGAAFGPLGMAIGGVLGALSGLPGIIKAMDDNNQKQFEYEQAKKKAEEAKITKAQTKDEYSQLKNLLESYDKLKENRNNSEEDYQAWIDANNQLAEAYPQLISYIDAEGNAIVEVTNASTILGQSMQKAARASEEYYRLKQLEYDAQIKMNEGHVYRDLVWDGYGSTKMYKELGLMDENGKWLNSQYDDTGYAQATNIVGNGSPASLLYRWDETEISVKTIAEAWEAQDVRQDYLLYAMQGSTEALSKLNKNELNWYNALKSGNFGLTDDMFTRNESGDITGWEAHLVNYFSGQTGKAELESTKKQAFQDAIYWQNEAASVDDVLSGVSGSTAIIDKFLRSKGYNDSTQIDSEALTTAQYSALIKPLTDAYDNLSHQSQQQLSGMYDNLGSYSYKQLKEEFNKYYGGANESNPLWNAYAGLWMDQNYRSASQYGQALLGDRYKGQTYEEWLKSEGLQDNSEAKETYYRNTLATITELDRDIGEFIASHASSTVEGYIDFLANNKEKIQRGGYAGMAAQEREKLVTGVITGLDEDGTYKDLTLDETAELIGLLTSEDAGSQAWADALSDFEERTGIEIADFDQYVFENFATHLNSLADTMDDSISELDSLFDKQSKGLSFSEAMNYYKKYAKEGQSWDDFYTVTADGKLIFSDFNTVLATATESMQTDYQNFIKNAGTMIDTLEGSGDLTAKGSASAYFAKAIGREDLNYTTEQEESGLRLRLEQYFTQQGFTKEEASSLTSALMSSADMTTEQFIDYMENMVLTSEAAQKYWEQNKERLIQEQNRLNFENAADNFTAALEGPFDAIEEGYKILSSAGITGLDADNVGKLLASGLFKEEDFIFDEVSGTYSLSAAARESLSSLPPWIQNTIEGMIEGSVDSAKNEMTGLAGQLFGDETSDATFASTFSHLQKTWKSSDIRRAATYALMQAVTGDTENLTKMITREYAARAGVDEATAAVMFKDEIAETQEEMIANFKDSYVDQIKTYNDLVYKKITGSATAKELEQLDDLAVELNIDLEQFTGRLIDDLKLYAQAIVDNAYLSADEKNKYLKDTYDTIFGATAYAESYGVDANYLTKDAADAMGNLSAATKVQMSSKNRMTQDQASTFAASIENAVGLSPDIVMSMFDYNQDDATWSFDASVGKSARDLQMTALWQAGQQNTKVMEEFQKHGITSVEQLLVADADAMNAILQAAMASEDQQILGIMAGYEAFDMIADSTKRSKLFGGEARAKTYATAVEQFASGQEMTFEELVNLYSELGQPIDTDKLYSLWLQGPEAVLNELMSLAETDTSLTAEQLSSVKAAKERGVTALLDSIASITDKAINGTATVDDLLTLAKNTGIDLSGKVIKTANGYGLNQTGMLAVAAARGRISGDYAGEAANLIEMYAGRGGTFGSSTGIDAAIARNESALNGIIQEAGDLLTKEDQFLTEEEKAKKKQYKLEKEQLEAEKEVLLASKDAFAKSAAKNAANFMNNDPYGGMGEDFANFLQSKQTAKEVLKEAYGNKGIISDYTQAGQFLQYIGYGLDWSPSKLMQSQNIMASYIKEDGSVDFVAGLKAIFPDWADLTPTEVLEKVAPYLDTSDQKVIDDYKKRIAADEEYLTKYDKIKADETQRVAGKTDGLIETDEDGKNVLKIAEFNKTITDVYGGLGVTDEIIADIAKTRYGEDWQTELADPEAMAAFMKDFDSLVSTFEYDPTSTKSAQQQFEEHIKGESAAQEVEERLKQLEQHLNDLTTDEAAMRPLLDGLDKSIQKAQYLNSLLVEARLGHSYSTGVDSDGNYTGVIFTDKTNVNEQNGTDQYDKYKEQLAQTYGLTESQKKYMKYDIDSEGNITGITYTPLIKQIEDARAAEAEALEQLNNADPNAANYSELQQEAKKATKTREGLEADYASMPESDRGRGEQGFSYQFRDNKELNTTGVDLNGTIKYTGYFKEIDDWIAENKHIEAIYTLSTPKEAIAALETQIEEATTKKTRAETNYNEAVKLGADPDTLAKLDQMVQEAAAEVNVLQSELDGLNERYPSPDDGSITLTWNDVTGDIVDTNAYKQLETLQAAGKIQIQFIDPKTGAVVTDPSTLDKGATYTMTVTTLGDEAELINEKSEAWTNLSGAITALTAAGTPPSKIECNLESDITPERASALATAASSLSSIAGLEEDDTNIVINVTQGTDGQYDVDSLKQTLTAVQGLGKITISVGAATGAEDPATKAGTIKGEVTAVTSTGETITITATDGGVKDQAEEILKTLQGALPEQTVIVAVKYKDDQGNTYQLDENGQFILIEKPKEAPSVETGEASENPPPKELDPPLAEYAKNAAQRRNAQVAGLDHGTILERENGWATALLATGQYTSTDLHKAAIAISDLASLEGQYSHYLNKGIVNLSEYDQAYFKELEAELYARGSTVVGTKPSEWQYGYENQYFLTDPEMEDTVAALSRASTPEEWRQIYELQFENWLNNKTKKYKEYNQREANTLSQEELDEYQQLATILQSSGVTDIDFTPKHTKSIPQLMEDGIAVFDFLQLLAGAAYDAEQSGDHTEDNETLKSIYGGIDNYLEKIFGTKEVTPEEFANYYSTLSPEEQAEIFQLALLKDFEGIVDQPLSDYAKNQGLGRVKSGWGEGYWFSATDLSFLEEYYGSEIETGVDTQGIVEDWKTISNISIPFSQLPEIVKTVKETTQIQHDTAKAAMNPTTKTAQGPSSLPYGNINRRQLWGTHAQQSMVTSTSATLDEITAVETELTAIQEEAARILTLDADSSEAQDAITALNTRIQNLINSHPTVFVDVKVGTITWADLGDIAGNPGGDGNTGGAKATGNVNGIALAKGNATSLIDGAKLANKTLVGELGPELGVWDGQYHLLGQHGAEFVNMPSDAIVFNHKQTKGIVNGQWGYRGKALAEGNVSGPAYAGGHIFDPWGLQYESFSDFVVDLGKGGGGKQVKATIAEDLEEWYNLLRKIAKLEAEISLIEAERANMLSGNEILRSYREQQALLHEQIATQKLLVEYQKEQLKLEADRIKQNDFWGKSLTFNEDGTLLSIFGNEANGGRGVFAFLDQLNELSGNQQVAMLKKLGYTYKDRDGKALEGEELVKQFIAEYQEIVTHYNELDDSILSAENTIEGLITSINDLEQEIKDNQKELEKSIYDILVEVAEREIEQIEEQNELLKEANEKYVQGLTNALNEEQSLYERNEAISDREALQRQLSLLRRSGGSASEIESLEQQLDETLKAEYFENQQKMIDEITKANERQVELMESQVKLQEEALEYQKENGVIWTKVYEVMNGSQESILNFFSGNSKEFFEASTLEQETMLLEWARMIGIYDEDRAGKQAKKDAAKHWEDGTVDAMLAEDETTSEYKDAQGNIKTKTRAQVYSELSDEDKKAAQEHYNAAYTSAVLEGKTTDEAKKIAYDSMVERLRVDANLGQVHWDPHGDGKGSGSSGGGSGNTQYVNVTYKVTPPEAKAAGCSISGPSKVAVGTQKGGIVVKTATGWAKAGWTSSDSTVAQISSGVITAHKKGSVTITQKYWKRDDDHESKANSQSETAIRDEHTGILEETFINKGGFKITNDGTTLFTSREQYKTKDEARTAAQSKMTAYDTTIYPKLKYSLYGFSKGGLVDYTGLAVVHGSQSKPEAFLNASQTAQITEALRETTGKESVLEGLRSTMDKLRTLVHNISTINNSNNQSISIAPGAVVIQVEQLADSYDIDEVSRDVMNRMVAIANKATNRGVNRR